MRGEFRQPVEEKRLLALAGRRSRERGLQGRDDHRSPLRVPRRDPPRGVRQERLRRFEQRGDGRRLQVAVDHLVERDQRRPLRCRRRGGERRPCAGRVAGLDERIDERVGEDGIGSRGGQAEERRHRRPIANPTERFGGGTLQRWTVALDGRRQCRHRCRVAMECRSVHGSLADGGVSILEGQPHRCSSRVPLDARQRPDGIAPGRGPRRTLQQGGERIYGGRTDLRQLRHRLGAHCRPLVVEQRRELLRAGCRPPDAGAARIGDAPRTAALHAVDRAEHIRLGQLRRRATELVPGTGVDDEQAAVGVFDDVGRVEVAVGGDEKVGIAGPEGRAVRLEHVPGDLPQVEHRREEVVLVVAAEGGRLIARESRRNRRPEMRHHRHEIAGSRVAVDDAMDLAIDAAVDCVHQRVAPPLLRMLEERCGEDAFPGGGEGHVHGVVHAAGHDDLDFAARRAPAQNVRRAGDERRLAGPLVGLLGERALRPVDPAVGPGIRPVQIVGAPGEGLSLEPFLTPIGDAVAVGIRQLPDAGGRGDVEGAVEPHRAFGEHHAVREHDALIEAAITVAVFEADNAMGALFELDLDLRIRAGRVGDVEPAPLVEVGDDRPIDEGRPGHQLDLEARGHRHPGR